MTEPETPRDPASDPALDPASDPAPQPAARDVASSEEESDAPGTPSTSDAPDAADAPVNYFHFGVYKKGERSNPAWRDIAAPEGKEDDEVDMAAQILEGVGPRSNYVEVIKALVTEAKERYPDTDGPTHQDCVVLRKFFLVDWLNVRKNVPKTFARNAKWNGVPKPQTQREFVIQWLGARPPHPRAPAPPRPRPCDLARATSPARPRPRPRPCDLAPPQ